jgi:hypothetical protein
MLFYKGKRVLAIKADHNGIDIRQRKGAVCPEGDAGDWIKATIKIIQYECSKG